MKKEIQSLMELQVVDLEISKLEKEMATGTADLEKQRETIDARNKAIAEYSSKLEVIEQRRREIEAENEDGAVMIKDRQTKMMNVQTNREYQSIIKEIEDAKNSAQLREDELIRLMEQSEYLENKIKEQQGVAKDEEKELADDSAKVEGDAAKLSTKKNKIMKTRNTKAKKVSAGHLRKYEQLRIHRNGLAVASVTAGVCHGCYMNIPPQLYNDLMKEENLLSCPACNRMIYFKPESEEA